MLAALSPVDYGVLLLYAGALVAVGLYGSSRQKTATEFFLAGRSLGWLPLGTSLLALLAAGPAFAAVPATAYEHGLLGWLLPAALWVVLPVVVYLLAPLYRGLALDSLFEYLEFRFDARVRVAASLLYIAWRFLWLAAALLFAGRILAIAIGWPAWMLIVLLGGLATLYTFLGGLRAVVACGVAHSGLLLLGVAVLIAGVLWRVEGGPTRVADLARQLGRLQLIELKFDWTGPWTLWALLPHALFAALAFSTADQVLGQRLLGSRRVNDARTAFLAGTLGASLLWPALLYAGLGLLTFYQQHPRAMRPDWVVNVDGQTRQPIRTQGGRELLDPGKAAHAVTWENIHQLVAEGRVLRPNDKLPFPSADELVDPERNELLVEKLAMRRPNEGTLGGEWIVSRSAPVEMLPHFVATQLVATQLPLGLAGIALGALVAGSLAAIDSSLLAICATIVVDLRRSRGPLRTSAEELQLARPLTLGLGAAAVLAALAAGPFTLDTEWLLTIASALAAPLLGVFLLGLLTRRATSAGTLVAGVIGLIFSVALLSQTQRFATSWLLVAGTLGTFLSGYLLSFILGRRKSTTELRGLVAGCGTLGVRSRDEVAPLITLPGESEGIRWR